MRVLAESSVETSAAPEAVWAVWADPDLRPAWHPHLEWATLDGPLVPGARGRWKPDRARPVDVEVVAVEPGRRLVWSGTHGHGPRIAQGHYVHEAVPLHGGGCRIVHRMGLTGALARPVGATLGRMLGVSATPAAVRAVARLAEQRGQGA